MNNRNTNSEIETKINLLTCLFLYALIIYQMDLLSLIKFIISYKHLFSCLNTLVNTVFYFYFLAVALISIINDNLLKPINNNVNTATEMLNK